MITKLLAVTLFIFLFSPTAHGRDRETRFKEEREALVRELRETKIQDERVLEQIGAVPRHEFIPASLGVFAYANRALPIGRGQTISQPYIVAFMTEAIEPSPTDKVLEIGTGSGYQAAVLSGLVKDVYTIEIVPELGEMARKTLDRLGYRNIHFRIGDGYSGWPERAPFDKIIVTAAPREIPVPLIKQLKEGGKLVIPVGEHIQELIVATKHEGTLMKRRVLPVAFVPMTGEAQK